MVALKATMPTLIILVSSALTPTADYAALMNTLARTVLLLWSSITSENVSRLALTDTHLLKDFASLARLLNVPNVLVIRKPAKNVNTLIISMTILVFPNARKEKPSRLENVLNVFLTVTTAAIL